MLLAKEEKQTIEEWAQVITSAGLLQVDYDMLGLCTFVVAGMGHELIAKGIKEATGLDIPSAEIMAAVRRTCLRGLALEQWQGGSADEYTLPTQILRTRTRM